MKSISLRGRADELPAPQEQAMSEPPAESPPSRKHPNTPVGGGGGAVTTKAEQALYDQTNILPGAQLVIVFSTLALTLLITFIDQNGISVTLPTIAADLGGQASISWAGTSSLIANTTFQMLYGRLSDIFGRKTVFLAAVALLVVADLMCGLSRSVAMFYVFRGIAGVGGGGITNLSMIIVSDIVTLEKRGKYQGIIGGMVGIGNVIGPFLAAGLIEKTSWRGFFYVLAPLGAVGGLVAFWLLPANPRVGGWKEGFGKIDYLGSFTSSLGIIFLLIPISGGGNYFPWDSPMVISMLTIGSLVLVMFVIVEWKFAKLPMMPVTVFHNKIVTVILIQSFLFGAVYQANLYYLPLYLQNAHQFSPLTSAAIYTALVGCQSLSSINAGLYISHKKRYGEVLWLGFGLWTLGTGLTLIYARDTPPGIIIIPLMLMGMGTGSSFQPTLIAIQAHSPKPRRAVIISNRNFFRCAGGACGLAISAAVLQAALRSHLPPAYSYLAEKTYSLPDLSSVPALERELVLDAYMSASRAVFILQLPMIGLCFLGCALIRDQGLAPLDERLEAARVAEASRQHSDEEAAGGGVLSDGESPEGGTSSDELKEKKKSREVSV